MEKKIVRAPVFLTAKDTYVCIPLLSKQLQPEQIELCKVESIKEINVTSYFSNHKCLISSSQFTPESWSLDNESRTKLFEKIKQCSVTLAEYTKNKIFYGIKTGLNEAFEINELTRKNFIQAFPQCSHLIKPFVGGQDIRRYYLENNGKYIIVIPNGWTRQQIASQNKNTSSVSEEDAWKWLCSFCKPITSHLEKFKEAAKRRYDKGEYWWELRACDYYDVFEKNKIIYPDIAKSPRLYLDTDGTYITNTAYCLGVDNSYLLGILNSKISWNILAVIAAAIINLHS